jgi:hypothetical protein
MRAVPGTFALTGIAVTFHLGFFIAPTVGAFLLTGNPAALLFHGIPNPDALVSLATIHTTIRLPRATCKMHVCEARTSLMLPTARVKLAL